MGDRAALIERPLLRNPRGKETLALLYSNRGIAFHALHLTDRAIDDYTRAIELKPNLATAYFNRANSFGEKHLYDQAIADYTVAIVFEPDVPTYDNRGWTYEKMGKIDLAIADFREALKLNPTDDYAQSALKRLGRGLKSDLAASLTNVRCWG